MKTPPIPIPALPFAPPVYLCRRATGEFVLDGRLDKPFWENCPYTEEFQDIEGSLKPAPRFRTRAKILWDDENLYVGALLEGDEIWATLTERDCVIFQDNDFEIFLDPDSDTRQYYEFEMNALNTVWDLFLPRAYRDGGHALTGYDIHGLRTAVAIQGSLNQPDASSLSWSVEIVIPFSALTECFDQPRSPRPGEYYRLNFSRVQWTVDRDETGYHKRTDPLTGQNLPEDNWVWAPTGLINIHYPEQWGFLYFTDDTIDDNACIIPEDEKRKWELRKLYYAQAICHDLTGRYTSDPAQLRALLNEWAPEANRTLRDLPYQIETTAYSYVISCPSEDEKASLVLFSDGHTERVPLQGL